jgi:hypothetical protein
MRWGMLLAGMMGDNELDRERDRIEEIERGLPEFAAACKSRSRFMIMDQHAFAPTLGTAELPL